MTLIGEHFRSRRNALDLSLFDVAVKAGVLPQTVSTLEKKGSCSLRKALKIAEALGMDKIPVG